MLRSAISVIFVVVSIAANAADKECSNVERWSF